MSLAHIYTELLRRARETGQDRAQTLGKGARIAVRVEANQVTLTMSRPGKKLGAGEIETFKRDCAVPDGALRYPEIDQNTRDVGGVRWYYIAYRWLESEAPDG